MTQAHSNPLPLDDGKRHSAAKRLRNFLASPADNYRLTRAIYLRALGVVYLCAFVSLWVQIDGLIGSHGILPAQHYLSQFIPLGSRRFYELPTLCWINCGDAFLHFLCAGGTILSLLLIAGITPIPVLVLLWAFYLSLAGVGQVFLGYQWDELLLEAGFLAIFFAPWTWKPRLARPQGPSRLILFLQRWLIFRLMFESGIVKLGSGDITWRSLQAMHYHYWTQPLPPWTAWYFAQLPNWFEHASVVVVFIAELLVPLFYFLPRPIRLAGFWLTLFFQCLILITGNYGFFNLLAIALCIPLTDDYFWRKLLRRKAAPTPVEVPRTKWRWPTQVVAPVALFLFFFSTIGGLPRCGVRLPRPLLRANLLVQPFGVASGYGLFAVMTTTRPEIIIEGSNDGLLWKPYEFKWKIGDVNRRPRFCTPHMPRLDWQMWFAALYADEGEINPWVISFATKLLQGDRTVLALMGDNPFSDHPPKYLRLTLYEYRFTTFATARPASPGGRVRGGRGKKWARWRSLWNWMRMGIWNLRI